MSTADIEAFGRGAEAINRLDADALAELVHEDAVFEPLRAATEGAYVTSAIVTEFRDGRLARFKDYGHPKLAHQAAAERS